MGRAVACAYGPSRAVTSTSRGERGEVLGGSRRCTLESRASSRSHRRPPRRGFVPARMADVARAPRQAWRPTLTPRLTMCAGPRCRGPSRAAPRQGACGILRESCVDEIELEHRPDSRLCAYRSAPSVSLSVVCGGLVCGPSYKLGPSGSARSNDATGGDRARGQ